MDGAETEVKLMEDDQPEASQGQDGRDGGMSPLAVSPPRQRLRAQQQSDEGKSPTQEPEVSPQLARQIKFCAQDLRIRQKDRQWAAELVNDFQDKLLNFLRNGNQQPYFQSAEFLNSGSYFEMVKIHSPNEFDMMLKLQSPSRLKLTTLDGGLFYQIDLYRSTRSPIRAFLLENETTLSASKILTEMHRLVRKFISTYRATDKRYRWLVNRKRVSSPAVTLSLVRNDNSGEELISVDVVPALEIHPSQGWPSAARNGPDVDNWLGKKNRQEIKSLPCYFVPKRMKGRKLSEAAKESWRISFSHIEKKIILYHGNNKTCCESTATKCCRKQCLKLLKCLIEGLKHRFPRELDHLCSYHGKTAFLHTLSIRFKDSMWARHLLPVCFLHLLGALEGYARSGLLPHFFVPDCNLFSPDHFPRRSLAVLTAALEEQRREGLPLLVPPAPAAPLPAFGSPLSPEPRPASSSSNSPQTPSESRLNTDFLMKLVLPFAIVFISVLFLM
ncbi:cyclic GMP-AMP synthase [Myripristis murdjan]|uniref:cyclic GMP-AMP synthase n=1 Tax=Myripristis murdjan TaxID=586833 RepID=UPI001176212B|nr:cyclic GMP-AMP synthase-like [Myripristis murdjan]